MRLLLTTVGARRPPHAFLERSRTPKGPPQGDPKAHQRLPRAPGDPTQGLHGRSSKPCTALQPQPQMRRLGSPGGRPEVPLGAPETRKDATKRSQSAPVRPRHHPKATPRATRGSQGLLPAAARATERSCIAPTRCPCCCHSHRTLLQRSRTLQTLLPGPQNAPAGVQNAVHCCSAALLRCGSDALLRCCTTTLLHCCTVARLHPCTAALLHYSTAAMLQCCTAALLHGCNAALLHCCWAYPSPTSL